MTRKYSAGSRAMFGLAALTALALAACGDDTGCSPTDGAIVVQVRDSVTGLSLSGVTGGRVRSPSFYGQLEVTGNNPLILSAAAPPGRYEVTVNASGYQPWSASRVEVESAGGCTGKTVTVEALLQPE